jgi:hypothetical protein
MNEKERGGELSRLPHVARCYGMLKIPAECDRYFAGKNNATFLCKFLLASLQDVSAVIARKLWWMNKE